MLKARPSYLEAIHEDFKIVPICALLGPRQCGKTTLARQYIKDFDGSVHYFDLEDPKDLAKLDSPKLSLENLRGLIVIDEVQRRAELFSYLRVLVDKIDIKILILGSASPDLLKQSSETLAGRIAYNEITPFFLGEVNDIKKLWVRGGYPRAYLAESDELSSRWLQVYMQTYFERDLANLNISLPAQKILKLWQFLTQYHGNIINYHEIARYLELSVPTTKNYLHILEGTFLIRTLTPWYENISKRQVKSPKLYIRDSGIYHSLINITGYNQLVLNRYVGASWEGFALEQVIRILNLREQEVYFWATHQGSELDLYLPFYKKGKIGFEFKYTDRPKTNRSMRNAIDSLGLDCLYVITPLDTNFELDDKIKVISLNNLQDELENFV